MATEEFGIGNEDFEEKLLDADELVVMALDAVRDAVRARPETVEENPALLKVEEHVRAARDLFFEIIP